MSVLVVGSVAFDAIETPFGRRDEAIGGSATFFSTAASLLTDVRLVAVVGEDFPEAQLDKLRRRQVDLGGLVRVKGGKTFRWKGRYGANLNEAETLDTQLNVFADFKPRLPDHFRDSSHVFLANIHPALQLEVLEQVKSPQFVALDTMNFWIKGANEDLRKVLRRVDAMLINDGEARLLAGEHNIVKAAKAIRAMGPKVLVVKRGEYGALLFDAPSTDRTTFFAPAYPLEDVYDPTGAGDTFAGGMMGYLAGAVKRGGAKAVTLPVLLKAASHGTVAASFNIESFSLDRLMKLKKAELVKRHREFAAMTRV